MGVLTGVKSGRGPRSPGSSPPTAALPFANNVIPAGRIDPIGKAFAALYPAPNQPGNDPTKAPSNNYRANTSDPLLQDFYTARIDHQIRESDRLMASSIAAGMSFSDWKCPAMILDPFRNVSTPRNDENSCGNCPNSRRLRSSKCSMFAFPTFRNSKHFSPGTR